MGEESDDGDVVVLKSRLDFNVLVDGAMSVFRVDDEDDDEGGLGDIFVMLTTEMFLCGKAIVVSLVSIVDW